MTETTAASETDTPAQQTSTPKSTNNSGNSSPLATTGHTMSDAAPGGAAVTATQSPGPRHVIDVETRRGRRASSAGAAVTAVGAGINIVEGTGRHSRTIGGPRHIATGSIDIVRGTGKHSRTIGSGTPVTQTQCCRGGGDSGAPGKDTARGHGDGEPLTAGALARRLSELDPNTVVAWSSWDAELNALTVWGFSAVATDGNVSLSSPIATVSVEEAALGDEIDELLNPS